MEGGISPALEFALEYIFVNHMIEDRHTCLTGRLVCRAWRMSRAFSSKITMVTLQTLADVKLAADLLPRMPYQRSPWRSVEESWAFPNLRTLKMTEVLARQLYKCSQSRDLLASLEGMDVDINIDEWHADDVPNFLTLAGVVSSCCFRRNRYGLPTDLFASATNVAALARLTRLTVHGAAVYDVGHMRTLSQLGTLRHLQLHDTDAHDYQSLAKCFSVCNALTQLTRLDITGYVSGEYYDDVGRLRLLINSLAPKVLHDFKIELSPKRRNSEAESKENHFNFDSCTFLVSLSQTDQELESCECVTTVFSQGEAAWEVPQLISQLSRYSVRSCDLTFNLNFELPMTKFSIDLTNFSPLKKLKLTIRRLYMMNSDEDDDEELDDLSPPDGVSEADAEAEDCPQSNKDSGDEEEADDRSHSRKGTNAKEEAKAFPQSDSERHFDDDADDDAGTSVWPLLTSRPGVQMAASLLEFETQGLGTVDLTKMVHKLPLLFPQLQHLKLLPNTDLSDIPDFALVSFNVEPSHVTLCLDSIEGLTKLTHLTLCVDCIKIPCIASSPTYFPVSLRELDISAEDLSLPSLSNAEFLTKVTVRSKGNCSLESLYGCQAPLRDLSLQCSGPQVDLPALVAAFPGLEVLDLQVNSLDVTPLSELRLLHTLVMRMPDSTAAFQIGALTNLASLTVETSSVCLDGLDNFSKLTHLRHLIYTTILPARSRRKYEASVQSDCQQAMRQLCLNMPHTTVQVYVVRLEDD